MIKGWGTLFVYGLLVTLFLRVNAFPKTAFAFLPQVMAQESIPAEQDAGNPDSQAASGTNTDAKSGTIDGSQAITDPKQFAQDQTFNLDNCNDFINLSLFNNPLEGVSIAGWIACQFRNTLYSIIRWLPGAISYVLT